MKRVYFIKPVGFEGPIKIGCSMAPLKRAQSLRAWCPFPLEILVSVPGDGKTERSFHSLFAHLHEGSEWFRAAPELMQVIDELRAGTFDMADLPPARALARQPRDLGYLTPAWCYSRSVASRLQRLRNAGNHRAVNARFNELIGDPYYNVERAVSQHGGDLGAVKDQVEPALETLRAEFGGATC